jgi:hypothetical protein
MNEAQIRAEAEAEWQANGLETLCSLEAFVASRISLAKSGWKGTQEPAQIATLDELSKTQPTSGDFVKLTAQQVEADRRRRIRCPICGASSWCSCGYGPEHNHGDGEP